MKRPFVFAICFSVFISTAAQAYSFKYSDNDSANTIFNEGVTLNDADRYKEAIPRFKKAIKLDPEFSQAYIELAYAYDFLEEFVSAIEFYKRGLELDQGFMPAHLRLVYCLVRLGRYKDAYEYSQKALRLFPDDPKVNEVAEEVGARFKNIIQCQEPKGQTLELVDFTPRMINFPFEIKYPARWYATEEMVSAPGLLLTREPVRKQEDQYRVGMGIYIVPNYFLRKETPETAHGVMPELFVTPVGWGEAGERIIEECKRLAPKKLSSEETEISGRPTLEIKLELSEARRTGYYVKAGASLIVITVEAPPGEFDSYEKIFEQMIESFSFKSGYKFESEAEVLAKEKQ